MNDDLKIIMTEDASHTLFSKQYNSSYHSIHGAIQESKHIFINSGLSFFQNTYNKKELRVLEIGFGTGLNAFLTYAWAENTKTQITFHSIEKHPLTRAIVNELNYPDILQIKDGRKHFNTLHSQAFGKSVQFGINFQLLKIHSDFADFEGEKEFYDLIYFDPFDFGTEASFWEEEYLRKLSSCLSSPGILITYGAKGSFKRALKKLNLCVEGIPGPPGKREISRATKLHQIQQ